MTCALRATARDHKTVAASVLLVNSEYTVMLALSCTVSMNCLCKRGGDVIEIDRSSRALYHNIRNLSFRHSFARLPIYDERRPNMTAAAGSARHQIGSPSREDMFYALKRLILIPRLLLWLKTRCAACVFLTNRFRNCLTCLLHSD